MSAPLRATAPLRGAHRLPMTSKQGNKNYYKGSGAANVFARQRITRTTRRGRVLLGRRGMPDEWTWMKTQVDESRTTAFVVPPGLGECKLRPFVFTGTAKEGGLPQPSQPGYLDPSWQYPEHKSEEATDVAHPRLMELHGVPAFEAGRFNPRFYTALSESIRERREAQAASAASSGSSSSSSPSAAGGARGSGVGSGGVLGRFGLGRK